MCLELCMERWVINKVGHQFQHWPLVECKMGVNEFVKENDSKFLASLDCKGVPMRLCKQEDWHEKMAWETLKCMTIRDLELALLFTTLKDDKHTSVKRHVADVKNVNEDSAVWATYEDVLSEWTAQYIGEDKADPAEKLGKTISSKYSTGFSFISEAPVKPIPEPLIEKTLDTVINGARVLEICVMPQRYINRLEVFTNDIDISSASINGIDLKSTYLSNRRGGRLVTHFVSDNDFTELKLSVPENEDLELTFYEASNNLLEHPQFTIPERPENTIPMPFVLNDAVLLVKKLRF